MSTQPSFDRGEIAEVEFRLHSLRDAVIKGDKPPMLFVSFSLGLQSYRTEVLQHLHPRWDLSQSLSVSSEKLALRIVLHEVLARGRERVMGRLKILLQSCDLGPYESKMRVVPLTSTQPDARCPGYMIYECFVTRYRMPPPAIVRWFKDGACRLVDVLLNGDWRIGRPDRCSAIDSETGDARDRTDDDDVFGEDDCESKPTSVVLPAITIADLPAEKKISVETRRISLPQRVFRRCTSVVADMPSGLNSAVKYSIAKLPSRKNSPKVVPKPSFRAVVNTVIAMDGELASVRRKRFDSRESQTFPEIFAVEPTSGSILGGTRITISGQNLGIDAQDVVGLYVCGSSCLATLEYESDTTIYCTTKAWRACSGEVTVITASGGRSQTNQRFSFVSARAGRSCSMAAGTSASSAVRHIRPPPLAGLCGMANEDAAWTPRSPRAPPLMPGLVLPTVAVTPSSARLGAPSPKFSRKVSAPHVAAELPSAEPAATAWQVLHTVDESTQTATDAFYEQLQKEKDSMQEYVDKLVARVLELAPEALSSLQLG